MECPKCGNEVKDTDKVCPFCKKVLLLECPICHKLNRTAVCSECGYVIIVKCHNCGTPGPNILGKCRKCGFDTAKSVIMNEAETEEYACLAITFPNLEDLRPALKNKTIFNKFKKKLKQALFAYASSQDNRAQAFGETYVIKYYKEFSLTSSVKKAVKSAIELLNKIGGISYKLKKSKNVRLHCKMTILKKTFETDNNEFNTGLNIKLIKDTTVEKYTDGLQLITDQYVNNVISRDYTLEMIYSSQVGDELLMFYEFPLEDQIIPIVDEEEKVDETSLLKAPTVLPKPKIYDDDDELQEILYGNKSIDITTESRFISAPAHDVFNVLKETLSENSFIALKTTERRELPTGDVLDFLKTISSNVIHVNCRKSSKFIPYAFFKDLFSRVAGIDTRVKGSEVQAAQKLASIDTNNLITTLLNPTTPFTNTPDEMFRSYLEVFKNYFDSLSNQIIFIENFDLIDEASRRIINKYLSSLINMEDLHFTFVVTVRSDFSIYKNISKLLHSPFYKEINVTKGDFNIFLDTIQEDISEIKDTFYIQKLEERCAGSLLYFKNELQYLMDTNIFIIFEGKLMLGAGKTVVYPATIKELLAKRFDSLPENEGLVMAYATLLCGYAHSSFLNKLEIENVDEAINNLLVKGLILYENSCVVIQNYRLFEESLLKHLKANIKKSLATNIVEKLNIRTFVIDDILKQPEEKLDRIYENALMSLNFGDFNAFLICAKEYFKLIDNLKIKECELLDRKNELYNYLVEHLNRYPSTKIYSISKNILANATKNNDDATIVNVSSLILDSALSGHDYLLAGQCMQNILTRILNPSLLEEGQDYSVRYVLYSCLNAKIMFQLSRTVECVNICDTILEKITPEFLEQLQVKGVDKTEFITYVMDTLVFSAISKIVMCDGTLEDFLDRVKEKLGSDILSRNHLILFKKLLYNEEFDNDAGISNDSMSIFIANIIKAFKEFSGDYNEFAQNIYQAKQSLQGNDMYIFSLICDLFIGYSYQKINVVEQKSWKKTETIYDDVYTLAQRSGIVLVQILARWFRATLLKDKGLFEEAYDLIVSVSSLIKRVSLSNQIMILCNLIMTINIVSNIEEKQKELPGLIYKVFYLCSKYNLEEYYKFIDDQRLLDEDYIKELQESFNISEEEVVSDNNSDDTADEESNSEENLSDEPPTPQE